MRYRLPLVLLALALPALAPAAANAGVSASATSAFPLSVTVGDGNVPASLTLANLNTGVESTLTNIVCIAGEASPPCSDPEEGIVLVPACKQLAGGRCTAAGAEPGVFAISPTATGRLGTACANLAFTTSVIDPAFGAVRFAPQLGIHVTLPGTGSSCVIDFTFSVLKTPTGDHAPTVPGVQTAQGTSHTQSVGQFGDAAASAVGQGTSTGTTVLRAGGAAITNAPSGNVVVGGSLTDAATVTGLVNPVAAAAVTFRLYPPSSPDCSGAPVLADLRLVTLAGSRATATSAAFPSSAIGVHRWIATYDGDANNLPVSSACNAANVEVTAVPDRDGDTLPDPADRSDASVGPTASKTAIAQVVSGQVFVRRPGTKAYVPLKGAEVIPMGSLVDARRGRVRITAAGEGGKLHRAVFYAGIFRIRQSRARPLTTEIELQSADFAKVCRAATRNLTTTYAPKKKRRRGSKKVVSRLWGDGDGRFQTEGRRSSAVVRGTKWLTQERCDGTFTFVQRGVVSVRDQTRRRTVVLRAGRGYLAPRYRR